MATATTLAPAAAAALLACTLQGCASAGKGVEQDVQVETPGCAASSCELSNDQGRWRLPHAPGTVRVVTSRSSLDVVCRADDGERNSRVWGPALEANTGAGAVAGGVAGGAAVGAAFGSAALAFIPVIGIAAVAAGVGVGAATGQALETGQQALRYPDLIRVPMNCLPAASAAVPAPAPLGFGVRGLTPTEAREAGLGERGAVLVLSVRDGGAAAIAGLRGGDIILAAGDADLRDAAALEERLRAWTDGTPLVLHVWRDGQPLALPLSRAVTAR